MKIFKNRKRGATLVEVAVALAVFAIVSATATTISLASVRAQTNTFSEMRAQEIVFNTVECFRYADSEDVFKGALSNAYGLSSEDLPADGSGIYQFQYENIVVFIDVNYNTNTTDNTNTTETITVRATYGEDKIIESTFTRA